MSDLIREALENLVRQQDGHPRSLEKLRRQGLSPDHPTVTATMEGHRLMMDRAWQQAREAISRTPYPSTRQQEVGSKKPLTLVQIIDATEHIDMARPGVFVTVARAIERAHGIGRAAAPSTPENAGGVEVLRG